MALNTAATNGTQATVATSSAYSAPVAARVATLTAQNAYSAPASGKSVDLAISYAGHNLSSVNIGNSEGTEQEALDKINAAILADANFNGKVKAQDSGGKIQLTTLANEDATITVGETLNGGASSLFGTAVSQTGSDGQTSISVSGTAVTLTNTNSNLSSAINDANLQLTAAGSAFQAYDAGSSKLGFREKTAQGATLTITGADAGLFGAVSAGTAGTNGAVKTVDQLVTDINNNANLTGKVKASNDNGKLNILNLSTEDLTVGGIGSSSGQIDGSGGTGTINGNSVRKNLITQFNQLRTQLDKLADDASFNGVNLLHGDTLKLTFNENNTSSISIVSQNANGVNNTVLGIGSATSAEFSNNGSLELALRCAQQRAVAVEVAVVGLWLEPVDRAEPSGLHEVDDQHPADRLGQPRPRRHQPGGRKPPRAADPPAVVDDRSVARQPVFAGGAAVVLIKLGFGQNGTARPRPRRFA